MIDLKQILTKEYNFEVTKIEKNKESTDGNVYIIITKNKNYVLKIYNNLNHANSIVNLLTSIENKIYVPKIIQTKNKEKYIKLSNNKYLVMYSFLEGISISKLESKPLNLYKTLGKTLRKFHKITNQKNYNLDNIPFKIKAKERYSALHFDLTKDNIFYNQSKIGFIDFDDAKYDPSVCDVAILSALIFFTKRNGYNKEDYNIFINSYYENEKQLKEKESPYIKEIALKWIDYTINNASLNKETIESFKTKRKLIEENL